MPLDEYRRKRRFSKTPEPEGKVAPSATGNRFVVQKHAAGRLHYDFRLELDGVLKSWAVPKGPSLDPKEKRLAVEVEDHPLDYADFEGVIPEGEYGGGTVMIWDQGTWQPEGDPAASLAKGSLKFGLAGQRLQGGWALVRMPRRTGEKANNWLLLKHRDAQARPLDEYDLLEAESTSISTGRTMEKIAADRDRTWTSAGEVKQKPEARPARRAAKKARPSAKAVRTTASATAKTKKKVAAKKAAAKSKAAKKKAAKKRPAIRPAAIPAARKAALVEWLEPELATLVQSPPEGDEWIHEIKFDGYRLLARLDGRQVTLYSRNRKDWTERLPGLVEALAAVPARKAWLDGELVALKPSGASDFQSLQNALKEQRQESLVYHVFDLVYLDGYDLSKSPLLERKKALEALLAPLDGAGRVRYTDHLVGSGGEFFRQSAALGLEGIVSKRGASGYLPGRGHDWLKTKSVESEEFIIGGFTRSTAAHGGLGALLVGAYDAAGKLVYAGRVGTGFNERSAAELRTRLESIKQDPAPFAGLKKDRDVQWVKPELVADIRYGEWTRDGLLRHPSFVGIREDRDAAEIVRKLGSRPAPESPPKPAAAKAKASKATAPTPARRKAAKKEPAPAAASSAAEVERLAGFRITHPDRVLYPEQGITKLGLTSYYARVGEWMLPHVAGRPLSLVRCPEGQAKSCFYQKHATAGTPAVLERIAIQEDKKTSDYLVVNDVAGLIALVQMGVLEIHPWGSRGDDLERPDRLFFDLDPDPSVSWARVVEAARLLRGFLAELGLECFLKTTGGKGLHLVAPLARRKEWPEVKQFAKAVAERLVADDPKRFIATMSKAARAGKIFIDYLRNDRGATAVAAYSTRAKPGAPVSVPLAWSELSEAVRSDHFTVANVPSRLDSLRADPWAGFFDIRQSITAAMVKKVAPRRS